MRRRDWVRWPPLMLALALVALAWCVAPAQESVAQESEAGTSQEVGDGDAEKPTDEESDSGSDGDDASPTFDTRILAQELGEYLTAVDRAAVAESTREGFGVQLHVYPDALRQELCLRLQAALGQSRDPVQLVATLGEDRDFKKLRKALKRKAAFRLDLLHPAPSEKAVTPRQTVQMFDARLQRSVQIRLNGRKMAWGSWRAPRGLEVRIVRVARHWTSKNYRLVPKISPVKPNLKRAVLRVERAAIWGVIPMTVVHKKKGEISLSIANYDQFTGHYTDEHIIDLNEESHSWVRQQSIDARKELPLFFPNVPPELERWLTWAQEQLD